MRVHGNYKLNFAFAGLAYPARFHVESPGIAINFNRGARLCNYIENVFDVAIKRRPSLY